MEVVLGFITIIAILWGVNWVVGALKNVASGLPANGLTKLEARLVKDNITLKESGTTLPVYKVEMRGPFPLVRGKNLMVSVSIFDKNEDGSDIAAFSMVPDLAEGATNVFLQEAPIGFVNEGAGFARWTAVLSLPAPFIIPAFGGTRSLDAEIRVFDANDPPDVFGGLVNFRQNDSVTTRASRQPFRTSVSFSHSFDGKGWLEKIRSSDESRQLAVGLALAVAMADGNIDDREGEAVRAWMKRYLSGIKGAAQQRLRDEFNKSLDGYYEEAQNGTISIKEITERINKLDDKTAKYEAVELCYAVMAADGHIDAEELKTVRAIAKQLELAPQEVQRIHDGTITLSKKNLSSAASDDELLGIEPTWDADQKLAHLRREFKKWNARLNSLQPGSERDQAQVMLEKIGQARAEIREQS